MDNFRKDMTGFFRHDLNQLVNEVDEIPEDLLWKRKPGIINSCGVLAQHITGNLNYYIGANLGNTGYKRDRDREFTNTGLPKAKLIEDIKDAAEMVEEVLSGLNDDQLDQHYAFYESQDFTVGQFLIRLYGHLNYHLGQVNYLRRISTENNG